MVDDRAGIDIAQLVAEHHQAVYRYAYRLSGSVPDAEDLTQQVFLTAQEKSGQLRKAESVRSWLFTILRNNFLKNCQKRGPLPAEDLRLNMNTIPEKPLARGDIDREALQQALDDLPAKYRLVLAMFYYEDCSYREISDRLGVPMGTVMSRLARAKAHLRIRLFGSGAHLAGRSDRSTASQEG
jgi:RNA polymerase sigma-70 factor (ECF subfamily)